VGCCCGCLSGAYLDVADSVLEISGSAHIAAPTAEALPKEQAHGPNVAGKSASSANVFVRAPERLDMRVLVDITHPVHVHLFKNLIWTLQNEGHDVLVTACEKDVAVELLRQYGIAHCCTGSYGRSVARKAMSVPSMDWELLRLARRFRPDVLLAEAPVRASHAAFFLRRPCIGLDDTEHAKLQRWLWLPFVTKILTPSCYRLNLGRKQLRYDGYKELAYLHPKYFTPDPDIPVEYGLAEGEAFAFVRFVSWNASHDIGQGGFSRAGRIPVSLYTSPSPRDRG